MEKQKICLPRDEPVKIAREVIHEVSKALRKTAEPNAKAYCRLGMFAGPPDRDLLRLLVPRSRLPAVATETARVRRIVKIMESISM